MDALLQLIPPYTKQVKQGGLTINSNILVVEAIIESDEDRDAYISGMKKLAAAQLAVSKLDAFKGNVITAETRDFWRPRPEHGGRGTETHWMANGESYWLIGEVMGKAMLELIEAQ